MKTEKTPAIDLNDALASETDPVQRQKLQELLAQRERNIMARRAERTKELADAVGKVLGGEVMGGEEVARESSVDPMPTRVHDLSQLHVAAKEHINGDESQKLVTDTGGEFFAERPVDSFGVGVGGVTGGVKTFHRMSEKERRNDNK